MINSTNTLLNQHDGAFTSTQVSLNEEFLLNIFIWLSTSWRSNDDLERLETFIWLVVVLQRKLFISCHFCFAEFQEKKNVGRHKFELIPRRMASLGGNLKGKAQARLPGPKVRPTIPGTTLD